MRPYLTVILVLLPLLLCGYRGTIDSSDALYRYQGAVALLRGAGYTATDGTGAGVPVRYGPLHSLAALPLLVAARALAPLLAPPVLARLGLPADAAHVALLTEHITRGGFMLAMPLVTLCTALLLVYTLRHLNVTPRAALWLTLLWAGSTPALVYANLGFDEPLQGLLLLAAFAAALRRYGGLAGLCLLLATFVRPVALLAAPALWLLLDDTLRRPVPARRLLLAWLAATALLHPLFNLWRYADATDGGYAGIPFSTPLPEGLAGLLFSPGKSLFIFFPFLLLLAAGIRLNWRALPRLTVAVGLLLAAYLLLYACWCDWSGDTCWGPRFFVPLGPLLTLLLVPLTQHRGWRGALVAAGSAGLLLTVPGALTDYTELWAQVVRQENGDGVRALAAWRYEWQAFAPRLALARLALHGPDTLLLAPYGARLLPGRAAVQLLLACCLLYGMARAVRRV